MKMMTRTHNSLIFHVKLKVMNINFVNHSNQKCIKDLINHCELRNKELNQNSLQSLVDYEKNLIIKRK